MRTKQPCPYAGNPSFKNARFNKLAQDWIVLYYYRNVQMTRYVVECKAHARPVCCRTMSHAVMNLKYPPGFCSECHALNMKRMIRKWRSNAN